MAEVSQARRFNRFIELDYEQLSGRYFSYGALLAVFRILWDIARTSGLLGSSHESTLRSISSAAGDILGVYAALGVIALIFILISRARSDENISSFKLVTNVAGVIIFLLFAARVSNVVETDQYPIAVWGLQLTNGLVLGGVYALVALGYTLVYGILFMINFAHGEVLVLGTVGGWFALAYVLSLGDGVFEVGAASIASVILALVVGILFLPLETIASRFGRSERTANVEVSSTWMLTLFSLPIRFGVGALAGYALLQALGGFVPNVYEVVNTVLALLFIVACGMLTSTLTAVALERIAYRPLRRAPRLTPLISAIGASFFLQQAMANILGPQQRFYERPKLISGTIDINIGSLGVIPVTKTGIIIVLVSILLMVVLYLFVQRSRTGRAMRSVAEDKDTAALMGVDVDHVIVVTFAIGAMLAGAAGVMLGFHNLSFNWRSGFIPGLKAFTAAVLGGIGNIPGAMFGGFFLGLVEALGPIALGIPAEYKDVIAFSLLVLVLIFRPTGIFGEVLSEKKV
ncbi:MAG TPA: branched-chain amino acid ABC transporter permease [Aggregatilinea sp.]|uniref:branched-chain amino acid ABC transporter permease n=1 Tax=Aggregatilinea sp. TaxID=2806333 RepID=UPI002C8F185F|nr:branched-chain amino acid ABC transporter permease [Aggregatilinea sp.]HML21799.1 branched-chain amino acid ABC transporter permease [Aggregatilinea sp.]